MIPVAPRITEVFLRCIFALALTSLLVASCGKSKHGKSQDTPSEPVFSQPVELALETFTNENAGAWSFVPDGRGYASAVIGYEGYKKKVPFASKRIRLSATSGPATSQESIRKAPPSGKGPDGNNGNKPSEPPGKGKDGGSQPNGGGAGGNASGADSSASSEDQSTSGTTTTDEKLVVVLSSPNAPEFFSPNNDDVRDEIRVPFEVAVKTVAGLNAEAHKNEKADDRDFYIEWSFKVDGPVSLSPTGITTILPPFECVLVVEGQGNPCEYAKVSSVPTWNGHDASAQPAPEGEYTLSVTLSVFRKNILGNGETKIKLIASKEVPLGKTFLDVTPPVLNITSPPNGEMVPDPSTPITLSFSDEGSGLQPESLNFVVDGLTLTDSLALEDGSATLAPEIPFERGVHDVFAAVEDRAGNRSETLSRFHVFLPEDQAKLDATASFLTELAPAFGFSDDLDDLTLTKFEQVDALSVFELHQEVNGIPVIGGVIKVGVNVQDEPFAALGAFYPEARNVALVPIFSRLDSLAISANDLGASLTPFSYGVLSVLPMDSGPRLVWVVTLQADPFAENEFNFTYLVDATTGEIVSRQDNVKTAQGTGNAFISHPAPPFDLDSAFQSVPIDLLSDPQGGKGCLLGYFANVANNEIGTQLCRSDLNYVFQVAKKDVFETGDLISDPDDSRTDDVTAYRSVTEFAKKVFLDLLYEIIMSKGNNSRQIDVQTNVKFSDNPFYNDNARVSPKTSETGALTNVTLELGRGSGRRDVVSSGVVKYINKDFTRNPDVAFHEFGHGMLFGRGIIYGSNVYGAFHEGFADFIAASSMNDSLIGEWVEIGGLRRADNSCFEDRTNIAALDGTCMHPKNYTSLAEKADVHLWGQAYAGAMWDLRTKLISSYFPSYDLGRTFTEGLALNSAMLITPSTTKSETLGVILPAMFSIDAAETFLRFVLNGQPQVSFRHEIAAAFAAHGILEEPRVAIIVSSDTPEQSLIDARSSQPTFNIYAGSNTRAAVYFSRNDSSFAAPCYTSPEVATTSLVAGATEDTHTFMIGGIGGCYGGNAPPTDEFLYFRVRTSTPGDSGSERISDAGKPHQYFKVLGVPPPPVCGDDSCNGTESTSSCPGDCPAPKPPPPVCGDGSCNGSEVASSCPIDCSTPTGTKCPKIESIVVKNNNYGYLDPPYNTLEGEYREIWVYTDETSIFDYWWSGWYAQKGELSPDWGWGARWIAPAIYGAEEFITIAFSVNTDTCTVPGSVTIRVYDPNWTEPPPPKDCTSLCNACANPFVAVIFCPLCAVCLLDPTPTGVDDLCKGNPTCLECVQQVVNSCDQAEERRVCHVAMREEPSCRQYFKLPPLPWKKE